MLLIAARTNAFVKDETTPNGPTPQDYAATGYDKGQYGTGWKPIMVTTSGVGIFFNDKHESSTGSLNRGIWKLLETSVRGWAIQRNQSYTIYVGGIYSATDKKIGNGVVVPHGFYKIVINNQTKEYAGWVSLHVEPYPNLGNDLTKFRVPVQQILGQAGVNFALPARRKNYHLVLNASRFWCFN
jgi:endonuclease G